MYTRFATAVALQRSAGPQSISVQVKLALVETVGGYEYDDDDLSNEGLTESYAI
jgi:hypothetical protein